MVKTRFEKERFEFFCLELGNDLFSINVRIEADPYWVVRPRDVHVTEGETVDFICDAESKPPPNNIQWFLNGVPLQDPSVGRNPRRRVVKNRMVIQNVTKLDTAVYQCNVTNIHGYVFANFFVNVICKWMDWKKFSCFFRSNYSSSGTTGNSTWSGFVTTSC
jgi:hypothetical protein